MAGSTPRTIAKRSSTRVSYRTSRKTSAIGRPRSVGGRIQTVVAAVRVHPAAALWHEVDGIYACQPEAFLWCLKLATGYIAQAIQRATDYVERLENVSAIRQSQRDQDAVIRNIEIIGEAARQFQHHAPEFVAAHPELPWIEMRTMRNKMIHGYFDVDV